MQAILATALALTIDMGGLVAPERPSVTNLGFEIAPATIEERLNSGRALLESGDHAAALEALTPAAEAGDSQAMAAVGLLHARGEGTERDLATGYKWLNEAAERDPQWRQAALTARMHLALLDPAALPQSTPRRPRRPATFFNYVQWGPFQGNAARVGPRYTSAVDYSANRRAVNRNTIHGQ